MVAVVNQNCPFWLDLVLSIQLNSFSEQRFIPLLIIFYIFKIFSKKFKLLFLLVCLISERDGKVQYTIKITEEKIMV